MTTVTLITGEQVDSASEAWRLETEARELLHWGTLERREYLATVERKRGPEAAKALNDAFLMLWEARKR